MKFSHIPSGGNTAVPCAQMDTRNEYNFRFISYFLNEPEGTFSKMTAGRVI